MGSKTCKKCGNIEKDDGFFNILVGSCDNCSITTKAILERLEEVYSSLMEYPTLFCLADRLRVECFDPDSNISKCELCLVFYIKHGRMISEKDLDNA